MTLQLLRRACVPVAMMVMAVLGCSTDGGDTTGVGGVLIVSRVDIEGGNRVVLIGGTRQLEATPRTGTGIAVPGKTVTWSSANTAIAQVSGTGLVTGVTSGIVSITGVVDGVTGRIEMEVRQVPVATVEVLASGTTLEAGQTTQLQAVTLDSAGGVLTGRATAWSSSNPALATVSPQGLVTGVGAGSAILTATSEGRSGSVTLTVTPRPASRLGFITQPSNATAGAAIAPAIRVALQDEVGSTVTSATGTITLAFASNPGGAVLTGVLSAPAVQGVATFSDVRVNRAGPGYTLRATAQGFAESVSGTFAVSAGVPAALAVAVEPTGGSATGTAFSQQPVIQLRDAQGNDARQAGVTVTAVLASGLGTLNGTTSVVTGSDGRAVFTNLAIIGSIGTYSLQFTATELTPTTSSPFSIGAGLASQLTFTAAPPGTAVNGQPLGMTVIVQLRDGTGNPVTQAGTLVTAAIQSGTGALGGTVVVATGSTGAAAFPGLVITGIVGNFTLRFSAAAVTPAVSNTIALQPGAATQLTVTTPPPATATNGVAIAPAMVVQLRDLSGNAVSSSGVTVTATILTGPGGVVGGTTAVATAGTGSATFSNLRITGTVGQYTLRFSASGVTAATANPLTLQPGAATALAIQTQPPPSTSSGAVLAPQPSVRVVDQSGNTVTAASLSVTAALASGPGTLGGTLTRSAVSGIVTFTNLAITGTTGTYTIAFSSASLTGVTSGSIGLGAGAATGLQFVGPPPNTGVNGIALTPAPQVRLIDGSLNPVAQSGVSVAAVRASGPGALGGIVVATTDANGVASFANLILTGTVGGYTIRFEVSGITPVTTPTIILSAGAATQLAFATAPPTSGVNAGTLAPATVVEVRDQSGNPVAGSGVSITADISAGPTPGGLAGTLTRTTAANGRATFNDLSITGLAGNYTLRFASAGLTPVSAPSPLTLVAGPATQLTFATAPPASATSGAPLSPQPAIQFRDSGQNPVTLGGVLITASVSGGASASNATATSDAGGLATFNGLSITGPAGSYTLIFSDGVRPNLASGPLVLSAGVATQIAFVTAPPASAVNGSVLIPQPVVELRDGSGNPVPTANVTVTASLLSGGGSLLGTTSAVTNGSGRATFSNLELRGLPGSYAIRFTSGALSALDSGPISLAVGPASQLLFQQAPPATATNDNPFTTSTAVKLADVAGNTVTTAGVSVLVAVASGPGATLGGTTTRQTVAGVATFDNLKLTGTAGIYTLDFTSGSLAKATSNGIQLTAGPATKVVFSTLPPTAAQSGVALSPAPVVQLQDVSNNNVAQAGVTVTVSRASGDAAVVITGETALTDAGGKATFGSLTLTGPADDYVLGFIPSGLTGVTSATITLSAGGAVKLGFVTTPSTSAASGQALAQQPEVQLLDAADNPVSEPGRAITISWTGSQALTATSLTVATTASGRAAFTAVTLSGTIGTGTLQFSGTGLSTLSSATITIGPGDPAGLAMVTQPPANTTSGATLSPAPSVRLVDAWNNAVEVAGTGVTVTVVPVATLGGTTTVATNPGGVAEFSGLSITGASGNYELDFATPGLTGVRSAAIAITAASGLSISTQPSSTVRNDQAFGQQPVIQLVDGASNPVAISGVTVTAAIETGGGQPIGATTAVTNASGAATFTDLGIRGTIGIRTLSFSGSGVTPVTSGNIDVLAGAATALAMVTQPAATAVDAEPLGQAPAVRVVDVSGNAVDSVGVDVQVASTPAGPALGGTTTQATVAGGTATFPGLSVTGAAGSYQLDFSATALTGVQSGSFALVVPTAIVITVEPPASAADDVLLSPQPSLDVRDAANAPVAGASVTVTMLTDAGGPGTLVGTTTLVSGAGGNVAWSDLRIQGPGTYRLQFATANGVTTASTVQIVIP